MDLMLPVLCAFAIADTMAQCRNVPTISRDAPVSLSSGDLEACAKSFAERSAAKDVDTKADAGALRLKEALGLISMLRIVQTRPLPCSKKSWTHTVVDPKVDQTVSTALAQTGTWDLHISTVVDYLLTLEHSCAFGVVVDVGANIGFFGAQAAASGCEVHSFEPQPLMLAAAESTAILNRWQEPSARKPWTPGLRVHRNPVSATRHLLFPSTVASQNPGGTGADFCQRIVKSNSTLKGKCYSNGCCYKKSVQLDDMIQPKIANGESRLIILKTDVEGFDADAMMTAKNLIRERQPMHVLFELTPGTVKYHPLYGHMNQPKLGAAKNIEVLRMLEVAGYALAEVPFVATSSSQSVMAIPFGNVSGTGPSVQELVRRCAEIECIGRDGIPRQFTDVWASRDGVDVFKRFNIATGAKLPLRPRHNVQ